MAPARRASGGALPARSRARRTAIAVAAAALVTLGAPSVTRAQATVLPRNGSGGDVGLEVANETLDQFAPASLATLDAALWHGSDRSAAGVEASVNRFETGHFLLYGAVHGALDLQHDATWRATAHTDVGGGAYRGQPTAGYAQLSLLGEHRATDATRIWAEGAVGHAGGSYQYATMHVATGFSLSRAGVTLSGSAKGAYASTAYADLTSQLSWRTPLRLTEAPIALTLDAGTRGGRHDTHPSWSSVSVAIPLTASAVLEATYGAVPSDPELAMVGARTATIGLHVGFARRRSRDAGDAVSTLGPDVRIGAARPGSDRRTIVIRIPNAATAEIMGDFTGWVPVALKRASATEWRGEFDLGAGVHRADVRVNGGAWSALPGTPVVDDDFGGSSSLLVVR